MLPLTEVVMVRFAPGPPSELPCPVVPGAKRDDWPLPDPKGRPVEDVRRIRDEIRQRVDALIASEDWKRAG